MVFENLVFQTACSVSSLFGKKVFQNLNFGKREQYLNYNKAGFVGTYGMRIEVATAFDKLLNDLDDAVIELTMFMETVYI